MCCSIPNSHPTWISSKLQLSKTDVGVYSLFSALTIIGALGMCSVLPMGTEVSIATFAAGLVTIGIYSVLKYLTAQMDQITPPAYEKINNPVVTTQAEDQSTPKKLPEPSLEDLITKGRVVYRGCRNPQERTILHTQFRGERDDCYILRAYEMDSQIGNRVPPRFYISEEDYPTGWRASSIETSLFKIKPHRFKYFQNKLVISFECVVKVYNVENEDRFLLKENSDYQGSSFAYKAHLVDLNQTYLAFAVEDGIHIINNQDNIKYKIEAPDQMHLNGNHLIAFSKKGGVLKIWDLENKKKVLEYKGIDVDSLHSFGKGFAYALVVGGENKYLKTLWYWVPGNSESLLFKEYEYLMDLSASGNYLALVTKPNEIEIFGEHCVFKRKVQLEAEMTIRKIEFSGAHILLKVTLNGKSSGTGQIIGAEELKILSFRLD